MRRLRIVVAASILTFGTVLLFARYEPEISKANGSRQAYGFRQAYGDTGNEDHGITVPNDDGSSHIQMVAAIEPSSSATFRGSSPQDAPESEGLSPSENPEPFDMASELPPSDNWILQTSPVVNPTAVEVEFPFQQDLELELPIELLKGLVNHNPHNYERDGPKTNAYATFMATRNPSVKDPYFMAIHSLIYRVLWSPRSRTQKYPFVVFVADFVTAEQRQLLSGAGAVVRELALLEWHVNVPGLQNRWKDLFSKLNMWKETEFERLLFLDADAFPVTNIDSMFDLAQKQNCIESKLQLDDFLADGTKVCEPYVFAGVPQNPGNMTDVNINVGSMIFSPSERMYQRLLQNYVKTDQYDCLMAEQAFLNWQFNINSAFPSTQLDREYGGFFPQQNEEGKLKVIHEKIWYGAQDWLQREWETQWQDMLKFYGSVEFIEERKRGR